MTTPDSSATRQTPPLPPTVLLHQLLAIEQGAKAAAEGSLTSAYHLVQKPQPFAGLSRTYTPLNDAAVRLPAESVTVQARVDHLADQVKAALSHLFDISGAKYAANQHALADIMVDGVTLLTDVPVETLLFLEKRLLDVRTFVSKLPTLSLDREWRTDANTGLHVSGPTETIRSEKVRVNHVLAPATEKHPAQVQVFTDDVPVGMWSLTVYSGAVPVIEQEKMLGRVNALIEAVKLARERANTTPAPPAEIGAAVLGYVFG